MNTAATNAITLDPRPAVAWCTYPGNVTSGFRPDQAKGPNTLGEDLWPVQAIYNPATNSTRVGFSYIAPTLVLDVP